MRLLSCCWSALVLWCPSVRVACTEPAPQVGCGAPACCGPAAGHGANRMRPLINEHPGLRAPRQRLPGALGFCWMGVVELEPRHWHWHWPGRCEFSACARGNTAAFMMIRSCIGVVSHPIPLPSSDICCDITFQFVLPPDLSIFAR